MSRARDEFLDRVRKATAEGNQPGAGGALPDWRPPLESPQEALPARFTTALQAVGGHCHLVGSAADAVDQIQSLIAKHHARRLVIGRGPVIDSLALDQVFRGKSGDVWIEPADLNNVNEADLKKRLFAAEIGITGVDWLIAETGSLVLYSGRGRARSLSLLPPVHIAVAHASQILADLFDLHLAEVMPSCVSLITGPSKTGDIELQLVTGVHGPGEVHVVLLTNDR